MDSFDYVFSFIYFYVNLVGFVIDYYDCLEVEFFFVFDYFIDLVDLDNLFLLVGVFFFFLVGFMMFCYSNFFGC